MLKKMAEIKFDTQQKPSILHFLFLVFGFCFLWVGIAQAQIWPMYSYDPEGRGYCPYQGPITTPPLVWSHFLDTNPYWHKIGIASDSTIYVASSAGSLYAVTPFGTRKWSTHIIEGAGPGSAGPSPAIGSDGTIYVGCYDSSNHNKTLYAINPDGSIKWLYGNASHWEYVRDDAVIGKDGTIYIGSGWYVMAINPDSTLKWEYNTYSNINFSSPAVDSNGSVYCANAYDTLYCFKPDGTVKWKWGAPYGVTTMKSPAISWTMDRVFINIDGWTGTTNYGRLYALDANNGSELWSSIIGPGGSGSSYYRTCAAPSIGPDGTIYVGGKDTLFAFHADGTVKWRFTLPILDESVVNKPTIGADGTVYFQSWENVYALEPNTGSMLWSISLPHSWDREGSCVLDPAGYIYICDSGTLKCYGPPIGIEETLNPKSKIQNPKLEVYPNPFRDKTVIEFRSSGVQEFNSQLYNSSTPQVNIYDVSGRLVKRFAIHDLRFTNVIWDGKDEHGKEVMSGVYFTRLIGKDKILGEKKVVLIR